MATIQANGVSSQPTEGSSSTCMTEILPVTVSELGDFQQEVKNSFAHRWSLKPAENTSARNLEHASAVLKKGVSPVAFPTETVYGLGADATSSEAVRGIYRAKNRPADNPLIVHFCHLHQLRSLLDSSYDKLNVEAGSVGTGQLEGTIKPDPIPKIYHELISKFWPGPLTILLPLPEPSPLAPEVTNSLRTFGARIPDSVLALALIQQVGRPLAAPSANASTRPSPTTAQHVFEDMNGRIEVILDGGACQVGVESTVVDGLSDPPCVLRPGGVSIEEIRLCSGWESVVNGYKQTERSHTSKPQNHSANGTTILDHDITNTDANAAPRAPGMKYRHYAPRAKVILVEARAWHRLQDLIEEANSQGPQQVGIISTRERSSLDQTQLININETNRGKVAGRESIYEVFIGPDILDVSRGLFGALRTLDTCGVDIIFAESRDSDDGQTAEAVMNRLRKAAEAVVSE